MPTGGTVAPERLGLMIQPTAGLDGPAWVPLGPGNIGGRTRSIVFHPTQHDTIWAASAGGGVWRTDDAGTTWSPVDDLMANLAVTSLALDHTDPDIIYAGAGEGFFNVDAIRGAASSGPSTARPRPSAATLGAPFATVNRIALSADGQVLLAGGTGGLSRSADPARSTWSTVLTAPIADVTCHPTDPTKAVASSLRTGMVWSTSDAGLTWVPATHAAPWQGRVEVVYAAADPDTVYASVDLNGGQIWRSTDGGATFVARADTTPTAWPRRTSGTRAGTETSSGPVIRPMPTWCSSAASTSGGAPTAATPSAR